MTKAGRRLVELPLLPLISNLLVVNLIDEPNEQEIPTDKTGNFDVIYEFLEDHWEIVKWVALGAVILEVMLRLNMHM